MVTHTKAPSDPEWISHRVEWLDLRTETYHSVKVGRPFAYGGNASQQRKRRMELERTQG